MKKTTNTAAAAKTSAPAPAAEAAPAPTLQVATKNTINFPIVNLDGGSLPDLDDAEPFPFDLMSDYWTPETLGEHKRLIFDKIQRRQVKSVESDEVIELDCAFFFEKVDGIVRTVCNGSKRLVGLIENLEMQRGTPLLITYLGKKKNASNNFKSDIWSVKPLVINLDKK